MRHLRRKLARGAIGAVLLAAAPPAPVGAEIYQWTDAQGRTHYTQDLSQVPRAQRAAARAAAAHPKGPDRVQTYEMPAARPAARRSSGREVLRIPFERQGTLMRVQVRLDDHVTAPFFVDTGASGISIPYAVARELGLHIGPDSPRVAVHTANGTVLEPVVTLASVEVGDARVEGVQANVSGSMQIGLLGGTFFNNFVYQIDAAASEISLVPNEGVRAGLTAAQWNERFRHLRGLIRDLDRHLGTGQLLDKARVRELEGKRAELAAQLEELDRRADRAQVPQKWRQ
jgi:clan AA aspartic protease (TIGR02281 family)